jgi:phosphomethylpyrimidine synthase
VHQLSSTNDPVFSLRVPANRIIGGYTVKEGVIGARIAAHAADVVKGVKGAADWDRRMSLARRNLDWEEQIKLSLDPAKARRLHERFADTGGACSMCGPRFCAMQITQEVRDYAARIGTSEEKALEAGMEQKSREFVERGAEIYQRS